MTSNPCEWTLVASALGIAASALAQPPSPPEPAEPGPHTVFFMADALPVPALGGSIDIVRGEGDVPGRVIEGKPYSARSITESIQTLADGNRITQRNEARLYRDSRGRTRREQTFGGVGPWQAAGEPVTLITINDPVAGKTFVLDPRARTARETRPLQIAVAGAAVGAPAGAVQVEAGVRVFASAAGVALPPLEAAVTGATNPPEDLGEQVLEGMLARGSRVTSTIAAGVFGNERPIEVVTEQWFSPDLDALVRHRHFDPRFGETTYELVNVARGEPSPDLFTLPAGYERSVETGPALGLPPVSATLPAGGGGVRTFVLRREPAAE